MEVRNKRCIIESLVKRAEVLCQSAEVPVNDPRKRRSHQLLPVHGIAVFRHPDHGLQRARVEMFGDFKVCLCRHSIEQEHRLALDTVCCHDGRHRSPVNLRLPVMRVSSTHRCHYCIYERIDHWIGTERTHDGLDKSKVVSTWTDRAVDEIVVSAIGTLATAKYE